MPGNLVQWLRRAIARLCSDRRGASGALVAIALPGLIGFGALGAETGLWFTIKLQNQSAADAAAISAGYQIIAGKTNIASDLTPAANEAAAQNGYKGSMPLVTYPYSDGIVSGGVAVTLRQTQDALLAAMFLSGVTIATKAVAIIEVFDNPCVLALATNGTGIEVDDSIRLDMTDCSAAANSVGRTAIDLHGVSSAVSATTLVTAGEVSLQGIRIDPAAAPPQFTLASPAMIGAPPVANPYAAMLTHAFLITGMPTAAGCKSKNSGGFRVYDGNCVVAGTALKQSRIKLSANTQISGTWNIAAGQTVDLAPGTYWVTGDLTVAPSGVLHCSACDNVNGSGVTLIFTTETKTVGTLSVAANAGLNLGAPRTGRFPGIAIIQDSHGLPPGTTYTSARSTIGGGSGATLNGLVYFPNSAMTFHGNPSTAGPRCLVLVVNTLTVDAASSLETAGCSSAGLINLPTVYTVALAE